MTDYTIVKNAVRCTICGSAADKHSIFYQCQNNPNHLGDTYVGIFADLTREDENENCTLAM